VDHRRHGLKILLVLLALAFSLPAAAQGKTNRSALHGAIAYHQASGSIGWATDRRSSREARVDALNQCAHPQCIVVASVSQGCAALAKSTRKFATHKGATRQEAETKALGRCGAGCEIAAWTCTK
jgi:hypothetical protein